MNALMILAAIILERFPGYPAMMQRHFGHPVQWMGAVVKWMETRTNLPCWGPWRRRWAGVLTLFVLLTISGGMTALIVRSLSPVPYNWLCEALIASAFLAQTQLGRMVRAVADGLDVSLVKGREAVSHIVGRDVSHLDQAEISRAAIETLAENASDGVIAPLFWLALFGLPGIVLYKAINTADSMIGHLDERYKDFGWASAKCDDLVNWAPARLTAVLFVLAAYLVPQASVGSGLRVAWRDAPKHSSPNAGWPEAAMAGALSFGLGGPRAYGGRVLDLPVMGTGQRCLESQDIRRALHLYRCAIFLVTGVAAIAALSGFSWIPT